MNINPLNQPQQIELLRQFNILAIGYNISHRLIEGDEDFVPQGNASRLQNIRRVMAWAREHRYPISYLLLLFDPLPNVLDEKVQEEEVIDPPPPQRGADPPANDMQNFPNPHEDEQADDNGNEPD